jgi:hypothetical protein
VESPAVTRRAIFEQKEVAKLKYHIGYSRGLVIITVWFHKIKITIEVPP